MLTSKQKNTPIIREHQHHRYSAGKLQPAPIGIDENVSHERIVQHAKCEEALRPDTANTLRAFS